MINKGDNYYNLYNSIMRQDDSSSIVVIPVMTYRT